MSSSTTRLLRNGDSRHAQDIALERDRDCATPSSRGGRRVCPRRSPTAAVGLEAELAELKHLSLDDLRLRWRNNWSRLAPAVSLRGLLFRVMAYRGLRRSAIWIGRLIRLLERMANGAVAKMAANVATTSSSNERAESKVSAYEPLILKPGALLIREWQGRLEQVVDSGLSWNGETYTSLSAAALAITSTKWNGHRILQRSRRDRVRASKHDDNPTRIDRSERTNALARTWPVETRTGLSRRTISLGIGEPDKGWSARGAMKPAAMTDFSALCNIYARLDGEWARTGVRLLHAQREAAQAYIKSQGLETDPGPHDDGGFSGGSLERPGLQKLLADLRERQIDIVTGLQGQSPDPVAHRLRQARRFFDSQWRRLRLSDPILNTTTTWDASPSTYCCLSPSSRSPASASATRSRHRRKRVGGVVPFFMRSKTAN